MINAQLEELVEITLSAFNIISRDKYENSVFELELRRKLMKKYCSAQSPKAASTTTHGSGTKTNVTLLNG